MNRKQRRQTWRRLSFGRVLRIYGTMVNYYTRRKEVARRGR